MLSDLDKKNNLMVQEYLLQDFDEAILKCLQHDLTIDDLQKRLASRSGWEAEIRVEMITTTA